MSRYPHRKKSLIYLQKIFLKITRTFFAALFVKVEGRKEGGKRRKEGRKEIHVHHFYLSSSEIEDRQYHISDKNLKS